MKTLYLIIIFMVFCCVHYAFAQAVPQTGRVSGKLIDANTGEAVDFATIAIIAAGSDKITKGTSSADGGAFNIGGIPFGTYSLQVTFVGYEKFTIPNIVLTKDQLSANVGSIKLKPADGALAEVVIGDKKKEIEYSADQITYNVAESINAEGSTATDILKNVPMVNVDVDGNATIAGKRSTRIFIDGKPSDFMTTNITDLLSVLPSDAIEKIEVMTNPPAKYSADGEGIINVVLKKGYKVGLTGTLAATAGTLGDYNLNSYGSYKTKTFAANASYGFSGKQYISNNYNLRQNHFTDTLFYRNNYTTNRSTGLGNNFRIGSSWDIDTINSVRFNTNLNINSSSGGQFQDQHYLDELAIQSQLNEQNSANSGNSLNYSADMGYIWKGGKKGQIDASANFSYNRSGNFSSQTRNFLDANGVPLPNRTPVEQLFDNTGNNRSFTFKVDYNRQFLGPRNGLSVGVDGTLRTIENGQAVNTFNFTSQQYITSKDLSSNFGFDGNIYSSYASIDLRTANNWAFRIGGRAELTDMSFSLSSLSSKYYIKPYVNVFPNMSISRNFKTKYTLGVSYTEKIQRPREITLNPQVQSRDSINISFGNPQLKPSYTRVVALNFGWFEAMWGIYPRIEYSSTSAIIERITTVSPKGISQTTYDNLSSSDYYTINLYGNYRFSKKVNFNGGGTLGSIVYQSNAINTASRNGFTTNAQAGLSVEMPQKLVFEGNMTFYKATSAQGRVAGSITTNFGMRKTMFRNKVKMRISVINPFTQNSTRSYIEATNFNRESFNMRATRNFSLTLSYNFSKVGKSKAEKKMEDAKPAMQKAAAGGKPF